MNDIFWQKYNLQRLTTEGRLSNRKKRKLNRWKSRIKAREALQKHRESRRNILSGEEFF